MKMKINLKFRNSNFVVFFFLLTLTSSCHIVNEPPEKEQILIDTTVEPKASATVFNFKSYVEQQNLSDNDKRALSWIVKLLTQEETFKEFKQVCADSSEQDLHDCLKLAKHMIYDMHIVFKKTPPLFKKVN